MPRPQVAGLSEKVRGVCHHQAAVKVPSALGLYGGRDLLRMTFYTGGMSRNNKMNIILYAKKHEPPHKGVVKNIRTNYK